MGTIERQASYTVRQALSHTSLIADLIANAHHREPPSGRSFHQEAYGKIVHAARSGDLASLTRETLYMATADRVVPIEVDLSNTQFNGALLTGVPFPAGYEPDILAMLAAFLPRDGVFFDVGANWGYFVFHLLLEPGFAGRVVALEPAAQSFNDLQRLTTILDVPSRATLLRVAGADRSGTATLSADAWSGNQSLVGGDECGERVALAQLDDLDLPAPALIKIDVEGYEAQVVKGARRTIATYRPVIIFESWCKNPTDQAPHEPFTALAVHGYHFYVPEFAPHVGEPKCRPVAFADEIPFCVRGELKLTPVGASDRPAYGERINVLATPAPLRQAGSTCKAAESCASTTRCDR